MNDEYDGSRGAARRARPTTPTPTPTTTSTPTSRRARPGSRPTSRRSPGPSASGRTRSGRRRRRRNLRVLIVLAVILLPFVIGGVWFYLQLNPTGDPGAPVTVQVKDGWGTSEVADALSSKGVVGSSLVFKVWAAVTRAGPFKPGHYEIPADIGVRGAMGYLEKGPIPEPDLKLLLPPGLTINQIADRVGAAPGPHPRVVPQGRQLRARSAPRSSRRASTRSKACCSPTPTSSARSESDESIVHKLVARFDEIATKVGLANSAATNGLTPYQTIVSASLIQTEAKLAEDAPADLGRDRQPAAPGDAAADRLDALLREGRLPARSRRTPTRRSRRRTTPT